MEYIFPRGRTPIPGGNAAFLQETRRLQGGMEGLREGFGVEGAWALWQEHTIRWAECDIYAHVNHAAYLTLCEDLRVSHWVSLGGRFEPGEPGPVVAQLEARYLRPLGFDDEEDVGYEVPWDLVDPVGLRLDAPLDRMVEVIKEGAVDGS